MAHILPQNLCYNYCDPSPKNLAGTWNFRVWVGDVFQGSWGELIRDE